MDKGLPIIIRTRREENDECWIPNTSLSLKGSKAIISHILTLNNNKFHSAISASRPCHQRRFQLVRHDHSDFLSDGLISTQKGNPSWWRISYFVLPDASNRCGRDDPLSLSTLRLWWRRCEGGCLGYRHVIIGKGAFWIISAVYNIDMGHSFHRLITWLTYYCGQD